MKKTASLKHLLVGIAGIILLLFLDQWTKILAIAHLKNQADISLIPGAFSLHYLENHGAAFGILQDQQWFFLLLGLIFLVLCTIVYIRMPFTVRMMPLRLITLAIAAGAIGNMIDRGFRHYVVDFFWFSLIDFPVFNVADIYITVGAVFLVIFVIFFYKDDELTFLTPGKGKHV
ncbi:MAG: signal peptidase II [Lachnospiraceae bacterium]